MKEKEASRPDGQEKQAAQTPRRARTAMLTPKDLSEQFGTSDTYWAKLRCSGDGPEFLKIGRYVFYEEDRVQAWLDTKRRTSTSDPGTEPEAA
jgi:hypothetical protein